MTSMRGQQSCGRPLRAFSLLELMVVMVVLCSLIVFAAPSLSRQGQQRRLYSQASLISAAMRYAYSTAVISGIEQYIHYNLDQNAFWITARPEQQQHDYSADSLSRKRFLPAGIHISAIRSAGRVINHGQTRIAVSGTGFSEEVAVSLRHSGTLLEVTVTLLPFIGETRIEEAEIRDV